MTKQSRFPRRTGVRRPITHYSVLLTALMFSASLLTSALVSAADSDLDPSFDSDGIVTTDYDEFDFINDIVTQSDGKIVAVGHSGVHRASRREPHRIMVARYNSDGSLDATFGSGGIVISAVGTYSEGFSVNLQADGKIVVGGRGGSLVNAAFAVVRYNPDGSLDHTFGVGGIVITSIGDFAQINDLAIQADGKIVVAGLSPFPGSFVTVPTLARYNMNGTLDITFDSDGLSHTTPSTLPDVKVLSFARITFQADQKVVAAGICRNGLFVQFCLSRYNPDSSLDSTFDDDGMVIIDSIFGGTAEAVSIQPDGKIVAAGQTGSVPALVRLNPDGSLDTTFDGDGKVTMPNSVGFTVSDLALHPNGQIVIAGQGFSFTSFKAFITVARYNSEGSIDQFFGNDGIVTTSVGVNSGARAVAVRADGRIVVGGFGNFITDEEETFRLSDFALVRYGEPVNLTPVVAITGPPIGSVFAVNTPINFTASFTDDTNDAHQVIWRFISAPQPGPASVAVASATPGPVTTTHTFTEPGVYTIALHVLDKEFLSGIATTIDGVQALVVIYDPNGGSVSGGGWIDSPSGALVASPAATGNANFAFVSQYQNGANVPTGVVQFHFSGGSLNFQSTGYEWLVVSGRHAVCKGTGTINGSGDYHFMLTSIDGDQPGGGGEDRLRFRIWSDSNGLIYDNQPNAPEIAAPTSLSGGSIVINH
jgi:uncharacterized delta-60 repeat protein